MQAKQSRFAVASSEQCQKAKLQRAPDDPSIVCNPLPHHIEQLTRLARSHAAITRRAKRVKVELRLLQPLRPTPY